MQYRCHSLALNFSIYPKWIYSIFGETVICTSQLKIEKYRGSVFRKLNILKNECSYCSYYIAKSIWFWKVSNTEWPFHLCWRISCITKHFYIWTLKPSCQLFPKCQWVPTPPSLKAGRYHLHLTDAVKQSDWWSSMPESHVSSRSWNRFAVALSPQCLHHKTSLPLGPIEACRRFQSAFKIIKLHYNNCVQQVSELSGVK